MADKQKEETGSQQQQQQQQQKENRKDGGEMPRYQSSGAKQPKPPRHNKLYRTPPTPTREELIEKEQAFVLDAVPVSSISVDYSRTNPKLGSALPTYNSQRDRHVNNYFQFKGVPKVLRNNRQHGQLATSIEGRLYDDFMEKGPGHRYLSSRAPCGYSNEERMGHNKDMWEDPLACEEEEEEEQQEQQEQQEETRDKEEAGKQDETADDKDDKNGDKDDDKKDEKEKNKEPDQKKKTTEQGGPDRTPRRTRRIPRELEGYSGPFGYRRNTPGLRQLPSQFGVCTDTPIYHH